MTLPRMFIVLLATFSFYVDAAKLPSYFKECSKSDKKLDECATASAIHGLPSLIKGDKKFHIPTLDPLHLDKVNLDVGESLKMTFTNLTIYGIKEGEVKEVKINPDEKSWLIRVNVPLMSMLITYDIRGRILILPIVGHGPGNFTLENVHFTYKFNYDLAKKNGSEYVILKDPKLTYEPSRLYFSLENLFNGDERLGVEMNKFLNENWSDVSEEIYPALAETINAIVTSVLNGYFRKVPYHEILSP